MKNKLPLSRRESRILYAAASISFLGFIYWSIYQPAVKRFAVIDDEIIETQNQLNSVFRTLQRSKNIEQSSAALLTTFRQSASDEQILSQMTTVIENIAGPMNIHIAEMKPQQIKKADYYNNFSVSLTLDGELSDILHFVYVLQNSPHFLDVAEFNLSKQSPGTSALRCELLMNRVLIIRWNEQVRPEAAGPPLTKSGDFPAKELKRTTAKSILNDS